VKNLLTISKFSRTTVFGKFGRKTNDEDTKRTTENHQRLIESKESSGLEIQVFHEIPQSEYVNLSF
jgi:hypothetical protein